MRGIRNETLLPLLMCLQISCHTLTVLYIIGLFSISLGNFFVFPMTKRFVNNNKSTEHHQTYPLLKTHPDVTCSVEVYECLAAEVVMETLAAVLLELDLFDVDGFSDHLALLFSSEEAVSQHAVYCDGPPLLSDLVSGLKFEKINK